MCIRDRNDTIHVNAVVQGGPSEKIGLMAGDRIVTVDDSYKNGIFGLNVDLRNHDKAATNLILVYELLDAQGKVVATEELSLIHI